MRTRRNPCGRLRAETSRFRRFRGPATEGRERKGFTVRGSLATLACRQPVSQMNEVGVMPSVGTLYMRSRTS